VSTSETIYVTFEEGSFDANGGTLGLDDWAAALTTS